MVSEVELRELKSQARELLVEAEELLKELADYDLANELNADTLRWLIPLVKNGLRRTDGKPKSLAGDKDAVGAIGALMFAVSETMIMLDDIAMGNSGFREAVSAATHKLPPR